MYTPARLPRPTLPATALTMSNTITAPLRPVDRHYAVGYECHCCRSRDTVYVQHYVLRRSLAVAPIYLCRGCGSISVDHDVVRRHYPVSKSLGAIQFHKRIKPRNEIWAAALLDRIDSVRGPRDRPQTVIDIGCGIGTLLGVAASRGARAIGYEVDALAVAEARLDSRLEIHDELFDSRSTRHECALVCCIAVMEHLLRPVDLLKEIADYCHSSNSQAFVFLPMLPAAWRPFLKESAQLKGNPFFDNEEHITHFSRQRFLAAWTEVFGVPAVRMVAEGWAGYFFEGRAT